MLTHHNLVSNVRQTWGLLDEIEVARFLMKGNCSILLGLPFFHSYGHWAMTSSVFVAWNMLLVPDPRDTETIVELMKKHRPLINVGVPTQYMRIASKKTDKVGVIGMSGSAALPEEVAEKYEEEAGAPVGEGYGLTETSPCTHANATGMMRLIPEREGREQKEIPPWLRPILRSIVNFIGAPRIMRWATYGLPLLVKAANKREKKAGTTVKKKGSIGTPISDTDCKLVDVNGEEVPFGESGEMWIKGPQVMKGYWPDPGAGLVDGWLPTGDVARMDEEGFFYIVDRLKDMINISGNKVYSRVVDDVLFQHPAVEMAAAIGIPDPDRQGSERVKAFLSIKPGSDREARRVPPHRHRKDLQAKTARTGDRKDESRGTAAGQRLTASWRTIIIPWSPLCLFRGASTRSSKKLSAPQTR
jgi:acyl-CoA synthetase (AMP-forming)/AMP-acid ligase II